MEDDLRNVNRIDLAPAKWIWLPAGRTLPNTELFFKKEIHLDTLPSTASGWIFADSRYLLRVNGKRVQWGPAPFDPRWPEVDPVDLAPFLKKGRNEIRAEVLWFGRGEGTYIASNPGFVFKLNLDSRVIVSDVSWSVAIDHTLCPGGHEQWFLRALQEIRDLRDATLEWMEPAVLNLDAASPTIKPDCVDPSAVHLRRRMIPLMTESVVPFEPLAESWRLRWRRRPEDCLDFRLPGSFDYQEMQFREDALGAVEVPPLQHAESVALIYCLPEEMVGWPEIEIEAPEGTIVEFIVAESHERGRTVWLDCAFHNWCRFICRKGLNRITSYDYWGMRWLELNIRGNSRSVKIRRPEFRRRVYPFAQVPRFSCSERPLQRLFEATVNTLRNSAQEYNADGCGRERQQYSGDVGHQQRALRPMMGESRHGARYLQTYSDGYARDGYFMDCWPGSDRLARIAQRQLGSTIWGPILDHGVQFVFDAWWHYLETGQRGDVEPILPKLLDFGRRLLLRRDANGLIPVTHAELGVPSVWMDHAPAFGWKGQHQKQAAFNLYVAGMLRDALAPLCERFRFRQDAELFRREAMKLVRAAKTRFWSKDLGCFVDNLPWVAEEQYLLFSDRTLSTALLHNFLSGNQARLATALIEFPNGLGDGLEKMQGSFSELPAALFKTRLPCKALIGLSYPPNAVWRHGALIKAGRMKKVTELLREWAQQPSVVMNNSLSETWNPRPDSSSQWSHCPVAPLIDLASGYAGLAPLKPGYQELLLCPQAGGLDRVEADLHVPQGRIRFSLRRLPGGKVQASYELPAGCAWRLQLPPDGKCSAGKKMAGRNEWFGKEERRIEAVFTEKPPQI